MKAVLFIIGSQGPLFQEAPRNGLFPIQCCVWVQIRRVKIRISETGGLTEQKYMWIKFMDVPRSHLDMNFYCFLFLFVFPIQPHQDSPGSL